MVKNFQWGFHDMREVRNGMFVLHSDYAALQASHARLLEALENISNLDPADTADGFNEWGEAQCFNSAQRIANEAIAAAQPFTET